MVAAWRDGSATGVHDVIVVYDLAKGVQVLSKTLAEAFGECVWSRDSAKLFILQGRYREHTSCLAINVSNRPGEVASVINLSDEYAELSAYGENITIEPSNFGRWLSAFHTMIVRSTASPHVLLRLASEDVEDHKWHSHNDDLLAVIKPGLPSRSVCIYSVSQGSALSSHQVPILHCRFHTGLWLDTGPMVWGRDAHNADIIHMVAADCQVPNRCKGQFVLSPNGMYAAGIAGQYGEVVKRVVYDVTSGKLCFSSASGMLRIREVAWTVEWMPNSKHVLFSGPVVPEPVLVSIDTWQASCSKCPRAVGIADMADGCRTLRPADPLGDPLQSEYTLINFAPQS
ncbi:hypothetical protein WJX73_003447 [Symbiochloris irregularis]|uniref:Uncharacterized protein n=1 Tax=Symbiochloris irregularis TaxID=706552 RepID=A0AAW1NXC7_9CHLO